MVNGYLIDINSVIDCMLNWSPLCVPWFPFVVKIKYFNHQGTPGSLKTHKELQLTSFFQS
jgi:hypothetical protein